MNIKGDGRDARIMLVMLSLVALCQQADKVVFSMVLEPMKAELQLSDTQLGALNGLAFALLYGLAALPIARFADRRGRRRVIFASLSVWSLFTVLSAFATGFATLFTARVAVGIGESGSTPASQSMIAARFPPERLTGAISVFLFGGYAGIIVGLMGAGVLLESFGWRQTLMIFGLPGLALAVALRLLVAESCAETVPAEASALRDIVGILRAPLFMQLFLAVAIAAMSGWGVLAWAPTYYMRSFEMSSAEVGIWLGLVIGMGTACGALAGGYICDRLYQRSPSLRLWVAFWALAIGNLLFCAAFLTDGKIASLSCLLAGTILSGVSASPIYTQLQEIAAPRLRATIVAVVGLGTIVIGQGGGPLLVGVISDYAGQLGRGDGLRTALTIVALIGLWPAVHVFFAARANSRVYARFTET